MSFLEENPAPITRSDKYTMSEAEVTALADALKRRSLTGDSVKDSAQYHSPSSAHNARNRYRDALIRGGFLPDTEAGRKSLASNTRKAVITVPGVDGAEDTEKTVHYLYLSVEIGTILDVKPKAEPKAAGKTAK